MSAPHVTPFHNKRASQVTENMQAIDVLPKLTDEVMARIEDVLQNKPQTAEDYR